LYRSAKATKEQITLLSARAETVLDQARETLDQSRKQLTEVATKTNEILDATRAQLTRIDDVLSDATMRARVQMDRIELVLDDTISRVQETVALVHNGILKPLREANGIILGVRAAISYLLRGGRSGVTRATHDEEMFI
jgi:ABC-type transporter Mla subunit MlaD